MAVIRSDESGWGDKVVTPSRGKSWRSSSRHWRTAAIRVDLSWEYKCWPWAKSLHVFSQAMKSAKVADDNSIGRLTDTVFGGGVEDLEAWAGGDELESCPRACCKMPVRCFLRASAAFI